MISALKSQPSVPAVRAQAAGAKPAVAPVRASEADRLEVSPSPLPSCVVRGLVTDPHGRPLKGATVTIKSLNPSNPFEQTIHTPDGTYNTFDAPAGVQLLVTASAKGFKSTQRVDSTLPTSADHYDNRLDVVCKPTFMHNLTHMFGLLPG